LHKRPVSFKAAFLLFHLKQITKIDLGNCYKGCPNGRQASCFFFSKVLTQHYT